MNLVYLCRVLKKKAMCKDVRFQEEKANVWQIVFEDETMVFIDGEYFFPWLEVHQSELLDHIIDSGLVAGEIIDSDEDSVLYWRPSIYCDYDGSPIMETPTRQNIREILAEMPGSLLSEMAYKIGYSKILQFLVELFNKETAAKAA